MYAPVLIFVMINRLIDVFFFVAARLRELSIPEVQMNEYKMTFNALNMAAKDLEHKLPIFAPFQTVDDQKQLVMLVSFLLHLTR